MTTVTHAGTGIWTTTAGNKTFTGTPAVNDLIVVVAPCTRSGGTTNVTDNNSDGNGTYTKIGASFTGFSTAGDLSVWVRNALVGSATSTVFTAAQASSTGGGLDVFRISGMARVGSDAVRQSAGQSSGTSGTTPAPVFGVAALTGNPCIGCVCNGTSPATLTPRTSWTEATDLGYSTPTTGMETMSRSSGETGTTQTWGSTSASTFASVVVELDSSVPPLGLAGTASNSPGVAGWSILQSNSTDPDPGSGALAYSTANVQSGTKLIAYITCGGGSNPEVTAMKDASLNSMTKLASAFLNGSAGSGELSMWAMDTPAGDVGTKPTITPTMTGGNQSLGLVIQEVAGLLAGNTTAMLDGTPATNTGAISSNGSVSCGAYSSTASGELLFALGGDNEVSTLTWAAPTGSTTYTRDAHAVNTSFVFNCVPSSGLSTGGAETASSAITGVSGSSAWATILGAFKLAPVSGLQAANGDITSGASSTTWAIAGTASNTSTGSGSLNLVSPAAGTASTTSHASGSFTPQTLAGTAATTSHASGTLAVVTPVGGTSTNTSVASGTLSLTMGLAGTASNTSVTSATTTLLAAIRGTAANVSIASGILALILTLAGTATSVSTATGSFPLTISGTSVTTSAANGSFTITAPVAGISSTLSGGTGSLTIHGLVPLAGTAATVSHANGSLSLLLTLSGTATSTSLTSGNLTTGTPPRTPQHLSGTITETNLLGGTVTGNLRGGTVVGNLLSGTVIGNLRGGTVTDTNHLSGSVADANLLGGTVSVLPVTSGSLEEWTMQEVDIILGEFNDETLAVAVLNNGVAQDLTGKTLQALFKTAAGVLDTDPSTVTLTSSSGGIVVTNAVGGLATITIPRADLASAGVTFWRLDVVAAGLQNTAMYGKVSITLL